VLFLMIERVFFEFRGPPPPGSLFPPISYFLWRPPMDVRQAFFFSFSPNAGFGFPFCGPLHSQALFGFASLDASASGNLIKTAVIFVRDIGQPFFLTFDKALPDFFFSGLSLHVSPVSLF